MNNATPHSHPRARKIHILTDAELARLGRFLNNGSRHIASDLAELRARLKYMNHDDKDVVSFTSVSYTGATTVLYWPGQDVLRVTYQYWHNARKIAHDWFAEVRPNEIVVTYRGGLRPGTVTYQRFLDAQIAVTWEIITDTRTSRPVHMHKLPVDLPMVPRMLGRWLTRARHEVSAHGALLLDQLAETLDAYNLPAQDVGYDASALWPAYERLAYTIQHDIVEEVDVLKLLAALDQWRPPGAGYTDHFIELNQSHSGP